MSFFPRGNTVPLEMDGSVGAATAVVCQSTAAVLVLIRPHQVAGGGSRSNTTPLATAAVGRCLVRRSESNLTDAGTRVSSGCNSAGCGGGVKKPNVRRRPHHGRRGPNTGRCRRNPGPQHDPVEPFSASTYPLTKPGIDDAATTPADLHLRQPRAPHLLPVVRVDSPQIPVLDAT